MPNDSRQTGPDQTVFFTVRTAMRGTDLLVREIDHLRHVMRLTRARYPFEIEEIVVLGDVIHTLWTMPAADKDFSRRWRMIKSLFSRAVPMQAASQMRQLRFGEKGIWQRRFWDHAIQDAKDLAAHRDLILTAPVQAGLVKRPEHWPHSSVHRAIREGTYVPGAPFGVPHVHSDGLGANAGQSPKVQALLAGA